MKSKAKSLQKLTETEIKFNQLLSQERITLEDIRDKLAQDERDPFLKFVTEKFNSSKGVERDLLYEKIEPITDASIKNQLWEYNQNKITWAISTLLQEYGRMPTKQEIALKTDLSRKTIHKHLKEYAKDQRFLETVEQFKFMRSKVLAKVFNYAVNGDVRAAKLYFEVLGKLDNTPLTNTVVNTQNNFIQINQLKVTQEELKQLKPEQLQKVEELLKQVVANS